MAKQPPEITHGNSCNTPIFQSATYFFRNTEEVVRYHEDQTTLGRYGRYTNPNWTDVERRVAAMEGAPDALLLTTGMTAVATTLLALAKPGDTVVYTRECYRNTTAFFSQILAKMNVDAVPLSLADPSGFEHAFRRQVAARPPRIVFLETPSNPHLYLADIEEIRRIVGDETILIVDSTLGTPLNFRPLAHGADLVVHSCTKYMSGHGDIMAGCVAGRAPLIDAVRGYRNVMGGIVDPHTAFILNRSLETFGLRMAHYNATGQAVADYLAASPHVGTVYYSGLPAHPHAALARKYLSGHGGVVSFELAASREQTTAFVEALEVPVMGSNFGAATAMVEQCAIFTYYRLSPDERSEQGISDQLIRLSVGYEAAGRLTEDLDRALTKVFGGMSASSSP